METVIVEVGRLGDAFMAYSAAAGWLAGVGIVGYFLLGIYVGKRYGPQEPVDDGR